MPNSIGIATFGSKLNEVGVSQRAYLFLNELSAALRLGFIDKYITTACNLLFFYFFLLKTFLKTQCCRKMGGAKEQTLVESIVPPERNNTDPALGYHLLAACAKGNLEQMKDLLSNGSKKKQKKTNVGASQKLFLEKKNIFLKILTSIIPIMIVEHHYILVHQKVIMKL